MARLMEDLPWAPLYVDEDVFALAPGSPGTRAATASCWGRRSGWPGRSRLPGREGR